MKVREDLGGNLPPVPSPELLGSFTILFLMVVPGGSSKTEHKWCFLEAGAPLPIPSSCWDPGMGDKARRHRTPPARHAQHLLPHTSFPATITDGIIPARVC